MLKFNDYDYEFKYKPARLNFCADVISRYPCPTEEEINKNLPSIKILVINMPPDKTETPAKRGPGRPRKGEQVQKPAPKAKVDS